MATPAQIRQAVDDKLALLWAAVQARQDTYAANHGGKFWQGLVTHTITPADGFEALPDIGLACPTDQAGEPYPLAIRQTVMPMSLRLDVYDGPFGRGYVATVRVLIGGVLYERSAQVGPEAWRAVGWRIVEALT